MRGRPALHRRPAQDLWQACGRCEAAQLGFGAAARAVPGSGHGRARYRGAAADCCQVLMHASRGTFHLLFLAQTLAPDTAGCSVGAFALCLSCKLHMSRAGKNRGGKHAGAEGCMKSKVVRQVWTWPDGHARIRRIGGSQLGAYGIWEKKCLMGHIVGLAWLVNVATLMTRERANIPAGSVEVPVGSNYCRTLCCHLRVAPCAAAAAAAVSQPHGGAARLRARPGRPAQL